MLIGVISQTSAEEALGASIDCSTVGINYTDNPEWTHSERLEAMDNAFFESVNRFELCNLSNQSSASAAASSGGDGGATESSGSESDASLSSTASSDMTGTEEAASISPPPDVSENSEIPENADNTSVTVNGGGVVNGSVPEDIPAADNDDVIAAQIRLAAEIEQDPIKKEKLWNEYRKYKGLPVDE
ncbi:MAG: hypothetical protein COA63_009860 [Methylophaga sp.]|nr:hypothetical protein [Methylophaga sp.]